MKVHVCGNTLRHIRTVHGKVNGTALGGAGMQGGEGQLSRELLRFHVTHVIVIVTLSYYYLLIYQNSTLDMHTSHVYTNTVRNVQVYHCDIPHCPLYSPLLTVLAMLLC